MVRPGRIAQVICGFQKIRKDFCTIQILVVDSHVCLCVMIFLLHFNTSAPSNRLVIIVTGLVNRRSTTILLAVWFLLSKGVSCWYSSDTCSQVQLPNWWAEIWLCSIESDSGSRKYICCPYCERTTWSEFHL